MVSQFIDVMRSVPREAFHFAHGSCTAGQGHLSISPSEHDVCDVCPSHSAGKHRYIFYLNKEYDYRKNASYMRNT